MNHSLPYFSEVPGGLYELSRLSSSGDESTATSLSYRGLMLSHTMATKELD